MYYNIIKKVFLAILFVFSSKLNSQNYSLSDCINLALNKNYDISKKQLENNMMLKNSQIKKREQLPTLNTSLTNNATFGVNQDAFGTTKRNDNINNSALLNLQFNLYNGGKYRFDINKSEIDFQASSYDLESSKRSVAVSVLKLFIQALLNKEIYNLSLISTQNAEKIFKKTEATTNSGSTSLLVLFEAKTNLYKEKQKLLNASLDVKRSLLELAMILQIENIEEFDILNEFENVIPSDDLAEFSKYYEKLLSNEPKIKMREAQFNSSKLQTDIFRSSKRPSIVLNSGIGSYYFNSFINSNEYNLNEQLNLNFYQQIRLNINIPIFSKGIVNSQIQKSLINEDLALNDLENEKNQLKNSIQKTYFEMHTNFENYVLAKEVELNAEKTKELAFKSYNEGFSTIYELNSSTFDWFDAVSNSKQFKYKFLLNKMILKVYDDTLY